MDTNLGKRKKKFNKKKQDHDPIIKKVKPQAPQKETEKAVVPHEPVEEQEQEEEKLNYDKFMDMFQQKDSRFKSKQAKKQTKVQNRVILKDAPAGDYTPLEIAKEDKDPFDTHYGYDHQELIENKVNLIQEKNPQSIANNDLLQKDFSYAFEEDEDLEVLNTEQGKVNNQVKLKEYQLKPSLKGPGKVFEDELGEIWVTDAKVEAYTNGENGFIHEPSVHPQFADHVEMENNDELNALVTVFPVMENYYDLVYTDANEENCLKFRKLWILHVLNHIKKAQEIEAINATTKKEGEEQKEDIETTIEKLHKVRGYTKARASVILPYKGDAFEVVCLIKEIYTGKGFQKKNPKVEKFLEEYGDEEDMLNDDFKIGLALNEGKLNLYCPFSKADIIITSPLGLRRVIGAEGDKEREYSFLSSIDTFVVERAHVIYMQNWQHMEEIMSVLNRIPRHKDMTNDINEIREYNFENLAKFYRQNIIYTEHKFAELNSLVARHFQNFQGIMMNKCFYDRLIPEDEIEINQEFLKFDVDSFQKEHEYRFDYFKTKVWEKIRFNNDLEKIVLFVSSYFDFLRLRSYFKKINASVTYVSEYTERPKAQSRIAHFINKKQKFLLITERAYYYSVGKLNNFGNIVFYSLPRNASIYRELIFKTDKVKEASTLPRDKARKLTLRIVVKSLFNKYDALALERIVGTDKCKEYIAEYNKGTTFIL